MILLAHWTLPPLALVLGAVLGFHEYGRRRLARGGGDDRPLHDSRRQAWLLRAGIAWAALTLVSPLGYWSRTLLPARAGLDLSFACLVPPLVVLGAPWAAFAAGARAVARRGAGAPVRRHAPVRQAPGGPGPALGAFVGVVLLWQVPVVLDASVRSGPLWAVQIACYLGAGTLLWLQVVGSYPFTPCRDPVRRVGLVGAALAGTWLAGVALVISQHVRYPAFAGGPLSEVMDQGLAGAISCVLPLIPLGIAAFWCFSAWMDEDEDDGRLERFRATAAAGPPGPEGRAS